MTSRQVMDAIVNDVIKSGIADDETVYVSEDGRKAVIDIADEWLPGYVRYMTVHVEAYEYVNGDEQGVTVYARATWMPNFSDTSVHARCNCYFYDDLEDVADVINNILYDVSKRALSYIFDRPTHVR